MPWAVGAMSKRVTHGGALWLLSPDGAFVLAWT
jgi:hypothetical protein